MTGRDRETHGKTQHGKDWDEATHQLDLPAGCDLRADGPIGAGGSEGRGDSSIDVQVEVCEPARLIHDACFARGRGSRLNRWRTSGSGRSGSLAHPMIPIAGLLLALLLIGG